MPLGDSSILEQLPVGREVYADFRVVIKEGFVEGQIFAHTFLPWVHLWVFMTRDDW